MSDNTKQWLCVVTNPWLEVGRSQPLPFPLSALAKGEANPTSDIRPPTTTTTFPNTDNLSPLPQIPPMLFHEYQYQTSDARSEPVSEHRASSSQLTPPPTSITTAATAASSNTAPQELTPGNMSDGTVSANHPIVRQLIERTARALEVAEAEHAAVTDNAAWHTTTSTGHHVSWWRAEKAGILQAGSGSDACRRHVEEVLDLHPGEWNTATVKAIFALGALSTFAFPGNTAFWAFWGKDACEATGSLVDEVVNSHPPLITVPRTATWVDKEFALRAVESYRRGWLPVVARPVERRSSRRQTKAKGPRATQGSSSRKRKAAQSNADPELPRPAAKRQKTEAAEKAGNASSPARPDAVVVEEVPGDSDTDTDIDVVTVAEPLRSVQVVEAQGPRKGKEIAATSAPGQSAAKDRRPPPMELFSTKDMQSSDYAIVRSSPQDSVEATHSDSGALEMLANVALGISSSPSTTPLPTSPSNDLAMHAEVALEHVPLPAAPSEFTESTVVGTATPSDELTRLNTPDGASSATDGIELDKVNAKLVKPKQAPVRSSARVRELTLKKTRSKA